MALWHWNLILVVIITLLTNSCCRIHTVSEQKDHDSHIFKYLLTINPTEMSDVAEYTCRVGNRSTSAKLLVDEGNISSAF